MADIIVCFTTANTVSDTASKKAKVLIDSMTKKMLIILTILIHVLVTDLGAKQTPHLSLGLTEAPTCVAEYLLYANIRPVILHQST